MADLWGSASDGSLEYSAIQVHYPPGLLPLRLTKTRGPSRPSAKFLSQSVHSSKPSGQDLFPRYNTV